MSISMNLDRALSEGDKRLQQGNNEMFAQVFELGFNLGQKCQALKDEKASLQEKIVLQGRKIEVFETLCQEKWAAHIQTAKLKMRAIAQEISKLIESLEAYEAQHPGDEINWFLDGLDPSEIRGTLAIHEIYLPGIKFWLKSVVQKSDMNLTPTLTVKPIEQIDTKQVVKAVASPQELNLVKTFPQMAALVKNMHSLEGEVCDKRQELSILEQNQELNRNQYQSAIRAWNRQLDVYALKPSLSMGHLLQKLLDEEVDYSKKRMVEISGDQMRKSQDAAGKEAERLKGAIATIFPLIQEAIEWTKL